MALETELQERLAMIWPTLAEPVRAAIADQEYKHIVRDSLASYTLVDTERESLEVEVLLVLLGIQTKEEFLHSLTTRIPALTPGDASRIASYIDTHFFSLLSPYLDETPPTGTPGAEPARAPIQGFTSPLEQFIQRQTDVAKSFAALPEEVRTTILSSSVADAFGSAVRTYNLTQVQFSSFGDSVVRVLVGLSNTKDFRTSLNTLGLATDTIDQFAAAVESGMFKPVRDAIGRYLAQRPATA